MNSRYVDVQLCFFAGQRDIVGQTTLTWQIEPGTTVGTLWEQITSTYPALQRYSGHIFYAVNQEFSEPASPLQGGEEVAFIPPVSGGTSASSGDHSGDSSDYFLLTTEPLNADNLVRLVQTPADGAVVTFAGVVRDNFGGRATAYLTYEAYGAMALAQLQQVAAEAQATHEIGRVAVHHRLGRLEIGETAVLVVVAAPHRQAAFAAAGAIMDRIKEAVPIWKREHWADGASDWHDT